MAVGRLYLADKSAWEQARYSAAALSRIEGLRAEERLAVCVLSVAELLYSARGFDQLQRQRIDLGQLPFLHLTSDAERRVPEVMSALAVLGRHRLPIPDLLLAVTAQAAGAVVLHYDSDFERIAEVTGQPHEWIIPRGSGHGRPRP
ncbi:MAG: PIN domain-containing protein [Sporichthyaceae bacterium]